MGPTILICQMATIFNRAIYPSSLPAGLNSSLHQVNGLGLGLASQISSTPISYYIGMPHLSIGIAQHGCHLRSVWGMMLRGV